MSIAMKKAMEENIMEVEVLSRIQVRRVCLVGMDASAFKVGLAVGCTRFRSEYRSCLEAWLVSAQGSVGWIFFGAHDCLGGR